MITPSIFSESVSYDRFREIALHFVNNYNADILLTSPGFGNGGRSFIGVLSDGELVLTADSLADTIAPAVKSFAFSDSRPTIGFVSYECGQVLRSVKTEKTTQYPFVHLKKYKAVFVHDEADGCVKCLCDDESFILSIAKQAGEAGPIPDIELPYFSDDAVSMSLDKNEYQDGVRKTLEYIRDGLTYQLNLTTMFSFNGAEVDPVLWFFALNKKFPAPYYALFQSCDKKIISTSPELFLRVENGHVLSEPIKGTLHFDEYSPELEKELTSSPKEDAELSMIVDLVRNDISSDCRYGSVIVEDHKSVFAVDNLLQMFSRVRGELAEDKDCLDLFFNAFPGGSITGCPKKSSMELIDILEPHGRGPYCGSIVLIEGPQDMVSSISIRTAVYNLKDKGLTYWAGSGIVIDSDPEAEYFETLAKAGKILRPPRS
ncbi:anthranilate synthase component I family protein [Maridesulfovibrio ferrireducens]|uniref:anthranilate synthase component I family protein n=1 Tax=Maridesulfovibrio ferrireducens TaxID=246191 RepID=UPI001A2E3AA0|nr:anthranilate synthase component I family protein [Maridesulfovibrio ferrireducens]MBI9110889.1 anthranilate synthase component I family protein [Maridesulfovibrio ferrireducens]